MIVLPENRLMLTLRVQNIHVDQRSEYGKNRQGCSHCCNGPMIVEDVSLNIMAFVGGMEPTLHYKVNTESTQR